MIVPPVPLSRNLCSRQLKGPTNVLIQAAVAVAAASLVIGGASIAPAATGQVARHAVDRAVEGWTLTDAPPPQDVSAFGGARAREMRIAGIRHIKILRYDGDAVVDSRVVEPRGRLLGTFIDDAGTIVVLARRPRSQYGLVWKAGDEPGDWTRLAGASGDDPSRSYVESNDQGDVAVFLPTRGQGRQYAAYDPTRGWQHVQHMPASDASGRLVSLQLTPDGRIVGLASDRAGGKTTMTMLSMPLGSGQWADRETVLTTDRDIRSANLAEATDGTAALELNVFETSRQILVVRDADGTVHQTDVTALSGGFPYADPGGEARFFVVTDSVYKLVRYDDGWSTRSYDRPRNPQAAISENAAGNILIASEAQQEDTSDVHAIVWARSEDPSSLQPVADGYGVQNAAVLDSGLMWIRLAVVPGRLDKVFAVSAP